MDLGIGFPLFIFEPSADYSETFMWELYEACRLKYNFCELMSRYIFDAVYQPPLRLMDRTEPFDGSFGFYDCASSIDLFRRLMDERKAANTKPESIQDNVFLLSLWDIYYALPYEYLNDQEDCEKGAVREERDRIKKEGLQQRKSERENLLSLMRQGEEYGIRMIISTDWKKRNYKFIQEVQQNAKTVLIQKNSSIPVFEVYTDGAPMGKLFAGTAKKILINKIVG